MFSEANPQDEANLEALYLVTFLHFATPCHTASLHEPGAPHGYSAAQLQTNTASFCTIFLDARQIHCVSPVVHDVLYISHVLLRVVGLQPYVCEPGFILYCIALLRGWPCQAPCGA